MLSINLLWHKMIARIDIPIYTFIYRIFAYEDPACSNINLLYWFIKWTYVSLNHIKHSRLFYYINNIVHIIFYKMNKYFHKSTKLGDEDDIFFIFS